MHYMFKKHHTIQKFKKMNFSVRDENTMALSLLENHLSSSTMQYSLYFNNHFLSQISFDLYKIDDTMNYLLCIHNFQLIIITEISILERIY